MDQFLQIPTLMENESELINKEMKLRERESTLDRIEAELNERAHALDAREANLNKSRVQTSETVQGKPSHATLKEEYETLTHKLHCGLHKQIKSYTSRNVKLLTSKIFQDAYDNCKKFILDAFLKELEKVVNIDPDNQVPIKLQQIYEELLAVRDLREHLNEISSDIESRLPPEFKTEATKNVVQQATSIAWGMLTLSPPAVLTCSPQQYSDEYHEWSGNQDTDDYTLGYYRPIMLYHCNGNVAVKGRVCNKGEEKSKLQVQPEEQKSEQKSQTAYTTLPSSEREEQYKAKSTNKTRHSFKEPKKFKNQYSPSSISRHCTVTNSPYRVKQHIGYAKVPKSAQHVKSIASVGRNSYQLCSNPTQRSGYYYHPSEQNVSSTPPFLGCIQFTNGDRMGIVPKKSY